MAGYHSSRLNLAVFRNPLLQVCSFLYISHSVWRQFFLEANWFLKGYLNDLLCMPLVLGAAVFLQRNVVLRQPYYALTKWQIGLATAYLAVMFEGVIPFFVSRYTGDFFDVICYGFGAWLFWVFGNAKETALVKRG